METFLWVEKYRPITVESCVLPSELKETFGEYVKNKSIPNLVLSGGPGVGKTTVAKAMIEQIGATYIMINGSEESGIDVLRTKIKNFASTVSLSGGRKYIILDEADILMHNQLNQLFVDSWKSFIKTVGLFLLVIIRIV